MSKLESSIAKFTKGIDDRAGKAGPDERPACTFGYVLKRSFEDQAKEMAEIKSRINALFFLVLGSIVVEVVMRVAR